MRPLVLALAAQHLSVWFDEDELRPGDSLIQSVEKGLARSRFGIVVLSPAFFEKRWPRAELDALATRELATGDSVLLPIWLDVDAEAVRQYSPLLADRYAVIGSRGAEYAARVLSQRIRPGKSPLLLAREELADHGISTPPPSDSWWLDVVESAAESADTPHSGLYRWGFPLPAVDSAEDRGRQLAQAVLRDAWKWEANERPITQITHPDVVHAFIAEFPGLYETCMEHPRYLGSYAPQLLIPGFGGPFEELFDEWLNAEKENSGGLETIGLHLSSYEGQKPSELACAFVQGPLFSPEVRYYTHIDYFFWLLSDSSDWLPGAARDVLLEGISDWGVWVSGETNGRAEASSELLDVLFDAKEQGQEVDHDALRVPLVELATLSVADLNLTNDPAHLADRLLKTGAAEVWLTKQRAIQERSESRS